MKDAIRKIVLRLFPELVAGYHLPRFARVVGIADTAKAGEVADPFRPHYAIDVELLTEQGLPDPDQLRLNGVPIALPNAGHETGTFHYPQPGTWVEIAWAYGRPHLPFVRSVLPYNLTLPEMEYGDQLWQHSDTSKQKVDHQGNWTRQTDGNIKDSARNYKLDALDSLRDLQRDLTRVNENSTELVDGVKLIEALGALQLISGGSANLASLDNINITSATEIQEIAGKLRRSFATELQHVEVADGGKVWFGNQSTNIIRLLLNLMDLVERLAATCASHTHPKVPVTSQSGTFASQSSEASKLKQTLNPITE